MQRLIDANALIEEYDRIHIGKPGRARKLIEEAPTIDAVEIIRCKNCKYHKDTSIPEYKHCCMIGQTVKYDAFCSYGKSITEDENNGNNSN